MLTDTTRGWIIGCSAGLLACGSDHVTLRANAAATGAQAVELVEVPRPPLSSSPESESVNGARTYPTLSPSPSENGLPDPRPPLFQPAPRSCKIDFLFVIDDSSSMQDEQANLVRSFPGFVGVLKQVIETQDLHLMVVGTGGRREDDDEPTLDPEQCDEVQGAGRRLSFDGVDCGIQAGSRYLANGQPNLDDTFACVAQVGTEGSFIEEPLDSILAATSGALNAPGRCNAGFLRDDAILVTLVITDEDDSRSSGDPEDWQELLLDVKRGDNRSLVVLGLVGDNNVEGGLLGGECAASDADGAPRLQSFVRSMGGLLGSVCAPDYAPFLQTAAGAIDSACADVSGRALL